MNERRVVTVPQRGAPDEVYHACSACARILLSRAPSAWAEYEPCAPDCELRYEQVCLHAAYYSKGDAS